MLADLSRLGKDLYYAFTEVDIQRVHTTLTIDDFDCITEDIRYIFYNSGTTDISILPLPAIRRKVQRNMKAEDSQNRKLIFIPASSSAEILLKSSTCIIENAGQSLPQQSQKDAFEDIKKIVLPRLPGVLKYEPDQSDIELVCEQLARIQEKEDFWTEDFLRDIFLLTDLLIQYRNGFYRPLIMLAEPLQPRSYALIRFSTERVREYLQDKKTRLKFNFLGRFVFSFAPEIHSDTSNHVRIYAPDGLVIRNVEFDIETRNKKNENDSESKLGFSSENLEKYLNRNKKDYFDPRCFYIQIGPEKSTALFHCRKHFNIGFGLSGLLKTLSWLWWLTILYPFVCGILNWLGILPPVIVKAVFSSDSALALFALSATFLVAVGIYAIEKEIVKHFITTHMILVYVVLTVEIFLMICLS